jgi:hypothetical protein
MRSEWVKLLTSPDVLGEGIPKLWSTDPIIGAVTSISFPSNLPM